MTVSAIVAILIFLATYVAIGLEKINRTIVAVAGAVVLMLCGIVTLQEAVGFISWETIGLLFGMFCIIAALTEAGFFTYLALVLARRLDYNPVRILVVFPIVTAVLACFMDSITVMLFFATLTYELARLLKVDPVPIVVAEVCLANTGGAATLVGDPPNVILGTMLGFNFNDFVIHTGPVAVAAGAASVAYFYFQFRRAMRSKQHLDKDELERLEPAHAVKDPALMKMGLIAFGAAILLLIVHPFLEHAGIPLTVPLAALVPAFGLLILGGARTSAILHKVEYEVLLFFVGLFVVVGGLEKTGVIRSLAQGLSAAFADSPVGFISALLWGSAVSSAVVDNVPFALTMAYVIKDIAAASGPVALSLMVWAVALGCDIGGNATPIGASANVVAYHAMDKHGLRIGWGRWMKMAIPSTVLALAIANLMLIVKYLIKFY
ncbi:MAG: SLC13 family permease [Candidatus Edwardsbacteria bacterium]|nr:SLC13 family permease [Candidatus Edwardsbacteria bacterium]